MTNRHCLALLAVCFSLSALHVAAVGADNWTELGTFSGATTADTGAFRTHGGRVRFVYSVEPNSTGPVPILLKMYPKGSPATGREVVRTQCIDCKGEHVEDVGMGRAGEYYVHVITSRPWKLRVEEAK